MDAQIWCEGLVRIFKADDVEVFALQGLDLTVERGAMVAVIGVSGSGKSTLLNILSGLDVPSAGSARVAGYDLLTMSARARRHYHRRVAGFVWQRAAHNLLPYLSAVENVELPMELAGRRRGERRTRALELLDLAGIGAVADRRPDRLSGSEKQRCAVAVALANEPEVLFADEPTGELDPENAADVFTTLRTVNAELGVTVLIVTHDDHVAGQVDRTVAIRDGRTSSEVRRSVELAADGLHRTVAREYAVLDRAGRMQLPAAFVRALSLRERVQLELQPDHVEIRPGQDDAR